MDIKDILYELEQNRGYFPQEAIGEAIQRREEIVPHLLRALQEVARREPESIVIKHPSCPFTQCSYSLSSVTDVPIL